MKRELTHDGERWSNAEEDRIEIVDYNPEWPTLFQAEYRKLLEVLPSIAGLKIEHVGSTAIPNLAAKPIIDIFIICENQNAWKSIIHPLESLDYIFWKDNPKRDRIFFVKGMPPYGIRRTHHVHVRKPADAAAELLFRDYLRKHPEEAQRYMTLKYNVMNRYKTDRKAYSQAKNEYISRIVDKAKTWSTG